MRAIILLFAAVVLSNISFSQNSSDKIIGTYLTQDKGSKVEFYKTGDKYFGKIVWLKDPLDAKTHKPCTDTENPDATKRSQAIMGLVIVQNIKFDDKSAWTSGTIYDPNTGKTWDCSISFDGNNLKVKGFWKISWIGKTEIWTKA